MTAVTRAGTLSRVMTSWGGTSIVTVLRSTLTILSTTGRRTNNPGPFGPPCTLPSLKITPRSYSLTILIALSMTETTNIVTITTTIAANPIPTACNKLKVANTRDPPLILVLHIYRPAAVGPLHGYHLHRSSLTETHHGHLAPHPYHRLTVSRVSLFRGERHHGAPPLAVHEHPPLRLHPHWAPDGAHLADHPLLASKSWPPSEGAQRTQYPE